MISLIESFERNVMEAQVIGGLYVNGTGRYDCIFGC
jgi:hypothetical protein